MQSRNVRTWHNLQKTIFHNDIVYTPAGLAKRCIDVIPFEDNDLVLDPARGKGAFYDNFPKTVRKTWCEYDDGRDFMMFNETVDWTVTNPPYSALNRWLEKACSISMKGVGYLIHLHSITPKRIQIVNNCGFGITGIYVCKVMDWFGMAAFLTLQRGKANIIKYDREVWK